MFHVSDFPKNTYFPERKIFLSVWLYFSKCCEKYFLVFGCMVENAIFLQIFHTAIQPTAANSGNQKPQPPKHHHHTTTTTKIKITQKTHFLTFSHIFSLPNKYIISSLNSETQIKPRKKNHNPIKLREEGREGGRSVLGSRTIGFGVRRIWVRDRGRRIGAATVIAIGAKARSRSGMTNLGSRSGTTNRCCDCDRNRREGEVERRSRTDSKSDGEPIVPSLFFLSLSLYVSARGRVFLSLSSLSVFWKISI